MAKSGIAHADVGDQLSKVEWLDEENHELVHGNSFPGSPTERQLFYRDDEHKWYIHNGTSWVSLQAAGGTPDHLDDIGDVNVPTPSDDDVLYWDNAASQWKCKANWTAAHHTTHEKSGSDEVSLAGHDDELYGLIRMGLDASKPAAGTAGRFYFATDTKILYRDTGGAWTEATRAETVTRLAQLSEKQHSSLTGIGASDHHSNVITITFVIDGGGSAITAGEKGHLEIPFACTITQVTMLADQTGSIVVDIWKDSYANFPPTDADSITASAPPTISSAQKAQDSTLTGWTTSISAGDILAFNVDSCSTIARVTLSLKVEKS
jgi:hypothetical protein